MKKFSDLRDRVENLELPNDDYEAMDRSRFFPAKTEGWNFLIFKGDYVIL